MSGYLRSNPFQTSFDGDEVKARLMPLQFSDLLKFQSAKDDLEAVKVFQEILPAYVEDFSGLNDAAGSPVSLSEVCSNVYFIKLVSDMGQALVNASNVPRPQKPAAPSAS